MILKNKPCERKGITKHLCPLSWCKDLNIDTEFMTQVVGIWLGYCQYGVKQRTINQSINQFITRRLNICNLTLKHFEILYNIML